MKKFYLLFLFVIFTLDSSKADYSKYFIGAGALTCREYISNDSYRDSAYNWIQGYMTGMNIVLRMMKLNTIDLWTMSIDEQKSFIMSFCMKNESSVLAQAGDALFDRLMKIQK